MRKCGTIVLVFVCFGTIFTSQSASSEERCEITLKNGSIISTPYCYEKDGMIYYSKYGGENGIQKGSVKQIYRMKIEPKEKENTPEIEPKEKEKADSRDSSLIGSNAASAADDHDTRCRDVYYGSGGVKEILCKNVPNYTVNRYFRIAKSRLSRLQIEDIKDDKKPPPGAKWRYIVDNQWVYSESAPDPLKGPVPNEVWQRSEREVYRGYNIYYPGTRGVVAERVPIWKKIETWRKMLFNSETKKYESPSLKEKKQRIAEIETETLKLVNKRRKCMTVIKDFNRKMEALEARKERFDRALEMASQTKNYEARNRLINSAMRDEGESYNETKKNVEELEAIYLDAKRQCKTLNNNLKVLLQEVEYYATGNRNSL